MATLAAEFEGGQSPLEGYKSTWGMIITKLFQARERHEQVPEIIYLFGLGSGHQHSEFMNSEKKKVFYL